MTDFYFQRQYYRSAVVHFLIKSNIMLTFLTSEEFQTEQLFVLNISIPMKTSICLVTVFWLHKRLKDELRANVP